MAIAPTSSSSLSIGTASMRPRAGSVDQRSDTLVALGIAGSAAMSAMWTTCFVLRDAIERDCRPVTGQRIAFAAQYSA